MAERLCLRDDPLLGTLVIVLAVVAGFAVWAGLTWTGQAPEVAQAITPHGATVTLDGQGAYRFNAPVHAWAFRAQDGVMALALLVALWAALAMRGARAVAVLLAALGFIVYGYASLVFGAALDWVFPAYVAALTLALLALWRAGRDGLRMLTRPELPRGMLAAFLVLAGVGTLAVWLPPLLGDLAAGRVPERMGVQITPVTEALDIGLIAPLCLIAAGLVARGRPLGHVLALPLLGTLLLLLPTIIATVVLQMRAGMELSMAEWTGPVGVFAVFGLLALWFLRHYLLVLRAAAAAEDAPAAPAGAAPA